MTWKTIFIPEASEDREHLDGSQKKLVLKAMRKLSENPLPSSEGGYGKSLGSLGGRNLTGCLKVKLRQAGIRIVYTLDREEFQIIVLAIGMRDGESVYKAVFHRLKGLKNV